MVSIGDFIKGHDTEGTVRKAIALEKANSAIQGENSTPVKTEAYEESLQDIEAEAAYDRQAAQLTALGDGWEAY